MSNIPHTYETAINHVTEGRDKDEFVIIETSEPTVIAALESKPERFVSYWEDNTPGCPRLVRFRIPFDEVNWAGLAKRQGSPRPHLRGTRPGSASPIDTEGSGNAAEAA